MMLSAAAALMVLSGCATDGGYYGAGYGYNGGDGYGYGQSYGRAYGGNYRDYNTNRGRGGYDRRRYDYRR